MAARKIKVSVTLADDLLARIDRKAHRQGSTRSALIEQWLRLSVRHEAKRELEEATRAYYDSLTPSESAEEASLSRGLSSAAKRLRIEESVPRARKRGAVR